MRQIDFYRALKQHCIEAKDCEKCCLRLYCYTPPCEQSEGMMDKVVKFLEQEQADRDPRSNNESQSHSDHYNCREDRPCICTMDIQSALGFSDR